MSDKNGTTRGNSTLVQAWLNSTDETEAKALEVRNGLLAQGFTDRQIITDAILRASGYTPEMFRDVSGQSSQLIQSVRQAFREELEQNQTELLAAFGREIVKLIKARGLAAVDTDDESENDVRPAAGKASPFMQNFARGFIDRQRQAQGDEDD